MNQTEQGYYKLARPWAWRERLRAKIFPFTACDLPEAPASFQDVIITKSRSQLGWSDRLRVLLTGKVEVETRIVTENIVTAHRSSSVIRCGRFHV